LAHTIQGLFQPCVLSIELHFRYNCSSQPQYMHDTVRYSSYECTFDFDCYSRHLSSGSPLNYLDGRCTTCMHLSACGTCCKAHRIGAIFETGRSASSPYTERCCPPLGWHSTCLTNSLPFRPCLTLQSARPVGIKSCKSGQDSTLLVQAVAAVSCTDGLPHLASLHPTKAHQLQQGAHAQDRLVQALMRRLGVMHCCCYSLFLHCSYFNWQQHLF